MDPNALKNPYTIRPSPNTMPLAPEKPAAPRQTYYGETLQPWDLIEALGMGAAFAAGNVIKYVGRYDKKGGLEDLKKCRWYLDRLIEIVEKQNPKDPK